MDTSRGAAAIVALLAVAGGASCNGPDTRVDMRQQDTPSQAVTWGIDVAAAEATRSESPYVVWIGIVNQSPVGQFACLSRRWILVTEGIARWSVGEGGSPHDCHTEGAFQVIRAGETLFVPIGVPGVVLDAREMHLTASVTFSHHPVGTRVDSQQWDTLDWEGTLAAAVAGTGGMLAPAVAPR